jgi:hypothetical protein
MFIATKAFTTPLRRFAEGREVTADELDGPLSAEDRIALGQIAPEDAGEAPSPITEEAPDEPEADDA